MKLKLLFTCFLAAIAISAPAKGKKAPAKANNQENVQFDTKFFEDELCTTLKPSVKNTKKFRSSAMKNLAQSILDGKFSTDYLCEEYKAVPSPAVLSAEYKLGDGFSKYENITGVYLEKGTNVVIVGDMGGRKVSLLLPDLMRQPSNPAKPTEDSLGWGLLKQTVELHEGVNIIEVEKSANAYVYYFEEDYDKAPAVSIHFATGLVNGYFDAERGDTNADWDKLLANAVSPIMDARSKHIHVAYPVEWYLEYTSGKGEELMKAYDALVLAQYDLMGLVKYNNLPINRVFSRVNFNYYMFRDRDGVAYLGDKGTMRMVADPAVVVVGDPSWGFSHEVGHIMQMKPMTWGGMTEVSNNINTLYAKRKLGNSPSRIMRQDNYNKAQKEIIGSGKSFLQHDDVFDRLVPFWQLQLYFEANGHPDFYADLMEHLRKTSVGLEGNDKIKHQFEFVKACCDVAKVDLTDFFDKWGFFYVGDMTINDYGTYNYTVTQEMVDETKAYIAGKGYAQPSMDITTISE